MLIDTSKSAHAKVSPIPVQDIDWDAGFWKERFDTCADVTVPHIRKMFEDDSPVFHVVENFRVAAGLHEGTHEGTPFGDGDFYKWMEAAMYVMVKRKDKKLEHDLDAYIELIASAQQEDGYLSTKQIIADKQGGNSRLGDINDFEVYNFGHLFTAACMYKRITGKDNFLKIALNAAEYLERLYKKYIADGVAQTEVCPSHYMGIVELYRITGDPKYLKLAEMALQVRDLVPEGSDDNQDSLPLREHRKIVGHGVRSTYLYAGVADVYAENGDESLKTVLDAVWKNCVDKKLYINGGCGALYTGTSPYGLFHNLNGVTVYYVHQAFGYEYQLPNITAYNETCATLGNIMWNYRMFAIDPQVKYFDIIERSMLNLTIASVSLSGSKYFYQNTLRRVKNLDYELMWPLERKDSLTCFCCPPNMARFIAESSEYIYMKGSDCVYTGMYGANTAHIALENGAEFDLVQATDYPWYGNINFSFRNVKSGQSFVLKLRIPQWVSTGSVKKNGVELAVLNKSNAGRYFEVLVENPREDSVELILDMPVRYTVAHSYVEENINQVAVERGPVLYCLETPDAPVDSLGEVMLPSDAQFREVPYDIEGKNLMALETEAYVHIRNDDYDVDSLYQTFESKGIRKVPIRMIPYFAWDNRGRGEMIVWMPVYWGRN
ncbi:glycoside hydrolase family 127 protein [Blautia schinkii]|nr:glycoside hydrolase family 127 protein [Blautia schinkii]